MVNTHSGRDEPESSYPNGPPPPPPPLTLVQAITSILEARNEHTDLLRRLVDNTTRGGHGVSHLHSHAESTYGEFLATHSPTFTKAGEPLETDNWLCTTESKFGFLCCTEHQKTLFAPQQLVGSAGAWWANFTTAHPADHQV
jgi:hypothetical protein